MKTLSLFNQPTGGIPGYLIEAHRENKPKRSSKDRLETFIRQRGFVKTSEIIAWGVQNYSNRAERNARQLATQKDGRKIRRMSVERKVMIYGIDMKEDAWEINPEVDPHFIDLIS